MTYHKGRYDTSIGEAPIGQEIIPIPSRQLDRRGLEKLKATIARGGAKHAWHFLHWEDAKRKLNL